MLVQRKAAEVKVPSTFGKSLLFSSADCHIKTISSSRNGLAERASRILSRSHTAFSLWQRETDSLLSTRRLMPDLRFRVARILHLTKLTERSRSLPSHRSGVVLCHPIDAKGDIDTLREEMHMLLLCCSSSVSDMRVSNVGELKENREIYVWHPHYEIELPATLQTLVGRGSNKSAKALLCPRFLVLS